MRITCCLCVFAASSWINLFFNQQQKNIHIAYLNVLKAITIPAQVNKKEKNKKKQTNK